MASTLQRVPRSIPQGLQRATHIQLSNVPPTATPADLRRLIARGQVQGVEDVAIDYFRLAPTGRAYLKLAHPDFLLPNLDALERVTISGLHPVAEPSNREPKSAMSARLEGNGLSSELDSNGKNVVLWGIPKALGPEMVDPLLAGFSVPPGEPYIFKMPATTQGFTMTGRFLVRLASVSEAHRLVRKLHMTHFNPDKNGTKYTLRARIIY
ncbi:hypothetical protein B0H19DRAFT_1165565 [Mycena capillaripes]|nr:hypothetical protein B0H19DRAFT_1165565 [Mycena capillaripes]